MKRIERVTIIGVGLIGGSFSLALKKAGFKGTILGCDSSATLRTAVARGVLDEVEEDRQIAVRQSDLIVLAAPVQENIRLLSAIAPVVPHDALITDVGSTKVEIAGMASRLLGDEALKQFLPGHPIAGREVSGVAHADADLFRGAPWALTPQGGRQALIDPELSRGAHRQFIEMLESIGARIVVTSPEKHDRILAFTSHLPQMVSTALATVVNHALGGQKEVPHLSGRALREMIRLAKSDPQLWKGIADSNSANLKAALSDMEQTLAALREAIGTADFTRLFQQGGGFDPDADNVPADDADPPRFL
jgi:prephenate dehydrogenase